MPGSGYRRTGENVSAQGVELKGLKLRRKTEALLFKSGELKFFN